MYLVVGEAYDSIAPVLKPLGAGAIVFFLRGVDVSIHLDDKFVFGAVKSTMK